MRYIDIYQSMDVAKFAATFKALAHPHRLVIFLRLAQCCVGELGRGLKIGQPTLSHHLKELTRAGLIRTRKSGQSTECWVAETTLDDLAEFFQKAKKA